MLIVNASDVFAVLYNSDLQYLSYVMNPGSFGEFRYRIIWSNCIDQ